MYMNRRESKRDCKSKNEKSSKDKKLSKLITTDSDTDGESEHELSYYIDDRVKLMKEVLKVIKPRKIKSMAPDCMKSMDLQEINSMLLEELLGISNKRLKYIFEGKTLDEESSTDEDQPIDVISLDDISDDDFVVISDEETCKHKSKHKRKKIKEEPREKPKKVKKEKPDKDIEKLKEKVRNINKSSSKDYEPMGEENLMSVLELLELQARARAIRSQLELENKRKLEEQQNKEKQENLQDDDDEIIMEVPQEIEIIIASSESENEVETVSSSNTSLPLVGTNEESSQDSSVNKTLMEQKNVITIKNNSIKNIEMEEERSSEGKTCHNDVKEPESNRNSDELHEEPKLSQGDSDSSSSDNLLIVKEREKRKKCHKKKSKNNEDTTKANSQKKMGFCEGEALQTNDYNIQKCQDKNDDKTTSKTEDESQDGTSKIDVVVKEFMKTQQPLSHDTEDLKKLQEEIKIKKEKIKKDKEKRLKNYKNKLQSFKQDVAVENSTINVLENIVIKHKVSKIGERGNRQMDDHDDLVINVDQDDLDCMVLD